MTTKPPALTRLRAAVDFYKHGWRKFNINPPRQQTKKIPFIWPNWYNGQPQWQLINYEAYASEGFAANAIIYSAIMYKTRAAGQAPLRAYIGDMEQPELLPPNHWLQSLCMRPNRFQSWSEFNSQAWVYWMISGNNYTVFERVGGRIEGMYNLRPDRTFIVPRADKREVIGFWYVPEGKSYVDGIPYLAKDVMHVKLPNPMDPLDGLGYGLSPLSPAAHSGDVDNDLTKFLRLFFKAGAMPSGLLTFDVPMEDDDVAAARRRWNEVYGGYENWAEESVAVLDQGGKYQRIGLSFQEMDVSAIDARNESRITGPFGVPLTLIESRPQLVQSTYSNKETDRLIFWEDTMEPELAWWQSDWQYYLQGDDGAFVMYDLSSTPAYANRQSQRLESVYKAFDTGSKYGLTVVTAAEYRAELGFDPLPDKSEIMPDAMLVGGQEQPQGPATDGDKPSNLESVSGLNGAQINAVLDVLERMQTSSITPLVATELLISVGIAQDRARRIIEAMQSGSLELPTDGVKKKPSNSKASGSKPTNWPQTMKPNLATQQPGHLRQTGATLTPLLPTVTGKPGSNGQA